MIRDPEMFQIFGGISEIRKFLSLTMNKSFFDIFHFYSLITQILVFNDCNYFEQFRSYSKPNVFALPTGRKTRKNVLMLERVFINISKTALGFLAQVAQLF